ncbi:MAG: hypothetical protein IKW88_08430 [Clostridiales bacterium]|nr:hypothetical protein [Clostridiales bacterium]
MNIKPVSEYKKPLYALGLAATVMLTGISGCRKDDGRIQISGEITTSTVGYEGETTVVNMPKSHINTEYDVSPYQVRDYNFYLQTKAFTSQDDLVRFSVSKLEQITKTDELCCEGRYQDFDFKIIRTDKFSTWVRSNDQYSDTTLYDGVFYLKYKRNAAESDLLDVYHDQSERFMIVTDCFDNKVIYEFLTQGNNGSGESTEFTGNTEFPKNYESFCLDEFRGRIMAADNALRWSKENHVVVFADSKCVSGKDMWEAFIYSVRTGKSASVLMADYHSADKKKKQNAAMDFYWIRFECKENNSDNIFSARVRGSSDKEAGASCYSKYFKHFSGTDDIFVMTDNDEMTAEEAEKLKFGLEDGDCPEQFAIRFKKEEKK